jgi:hypothetical protein
MENVVGTKNQMDGNSIPGVRPQLPHIAVNMAIVEVLSNTKIMVKLNTIITTMFHRKKVVVELIPIPKLTMEGAKLKQPHTVVQLDIVGPVNHIGKVDRMIITTKVSKPLELRITKIKFQNKIY